MLAAADACIEAGAYDSAISRAYYASFHSAVGYLQEKVGVPPGRGGRWSHQYVGDAFYRVAKQEGALVHDLYQARTRADYTTASHTEDDAARAIEMARKVYDFCVRSLTSGAGTE